MNRHPHPASSYTPCCGSHFWIYICVIVVLITFAGLMSGLTLGLMSLDLFDLEVLKRSANPKTVKYATKIFPVVQKQHLLLVTLLLGNAIAMEALPIFLDSLVEPYVAIILSVTLILMFGEILPQAVCSRYGLQVGAAMAPVVRVLITIVYPVAYPISVLLDQLLGGHHVTLFIRDELKTLVEMHGAEAGMGGELTNEETNIITGALELRTNTAGLVMTPIAQTYSLSLDAKLDETLMTHIFTTGHSRIPIYRENPNNIVGVLLVKTLLGIEPQDTIRVADLGMQRIPRIPEDMTLDDVLMEFQQGRSRIAVVVRNSNISTAVHHHVVSVEEGQNLKQNHEKESDSVTKLPISNTAVTTLIIGVPNPQQHGQETLPSLENPVQPDSAGSFARDSAPSEKFEAVGIITMEDILEKILNGDVLDETDTTFPYLELANSRLPRPHAFGTSKPPSPQFSFETASVPHLPDTVCPK